MKMNPLNDTLSLPAFRGATLRVRAINTMAVLSCKTEALMTPVFDGYEKIEIPTFAFLIEGESRKTRLLFDCGVRTDNGYYSPSVSRMIEETTSSLRVDENIHEILLDAGYALDSLGMVPCILSMLHSS
jgi:hypothetical protein